MTILDEISSYLKIQEKLIDALQITPTYIRLILFEKEFVSYKSILNQYQLRLRFIEKRLFNALDLHLYIYYDNNPLELTLRILNPTSITYKAIEEIFPSTKVFIDEINQIKDIL